MKNLADLADICPTMHIRRHLRSSQVSVHTLASITGLRSHTPQHYRSLCTHSSASQVSIHTRLHYRSLYTHLPASQVSPASHTVPKVLNFLRYNMTYSGAKVILRGLVHVVSCFPLHFILYHRNLNCFSNSACLTGLRAHNQRQYRSQCTQACMTGRCTRMLQFMWQVFSTRSAFFLQWFISVESLQCLI